MAESNSQEKNIARNLAAQIQSGFYSDGTRFPSALEIARQFQVSYCPAQRALKALDNAGLIKIARGRETVVLKKPVDDFLQSDTFKKRVVALHDLSQSLRLISPAISLEGMRHLQAVPPAAKMPENSNVIHYWKRLYALFDQTLASLGNQTIASLYQDINAFTESAFIDIVHTFQSEGEEKDLLSQQVGDFEACISHSLKGEYDAARDGFERLTGTFCDRIEHYLNRLPADPGQALQETFSWQPNKGRTRYSDMIAIDLVRRINEGIYPVGTLLPNGAILAGLYHVSAITIRRTIGLLNRLEVVKTFNGVGTRVIDAHPSGTSDRLKAMILANNLRTFLEAYQLLAITCEPLVAHAFPHFSGERLEAILQATRITDRTQGITALTSACLQGIINDSPLAAIREIYTRLTLLLLNGSALMFDRIGMDVNWPEVSGVIAEAVSRGDSARFASVYRSLIGKVFPAVKSHLTSIGVPGIGQIAVPAFRQTGEHPGPA